MHSFLGMGRRGRHWRASKTSLDWISGNVKFPNFLIQPNSDDLSSNQQTWSYALQYLVVIPGCALDFHWEIIQITLGCSIIGGYGWLVSEN